MQAGMGACLAPQDAQLGMAEQAVIALAYNGGGQRGLWIQDSLRRLGVPVGAAGPP